MIRRVVLAAFVGALVTIPLTPPANADLVNCEGETFYAPKKYTLECWTSLLPQHRIGYECEKGYVVCNNLDPTWEDTVCPLIQRVPGVWCH